VEHLGFIERLRIVKSNVPFLLLNGAIIVHLAAITVVATIVNYYFKYNLRSEALTPVAFVGLFVAAALTLPLWLKLEKKIGRKATFNAGMALLSLMLVPLILIENPNPYVVIAVMIVAGAGMSTIYVFPWSMVPSTIDYSEWKTGQRHEGLFYGFFYFSFKAAAALGGLLAGLGLDLAGYSASAGESGTLGDGTLTGIRILLTALPIALMMAGIAFVHFYPIDEAMERQFRHS
jgi:GPH family glycoside/pentoside/hexuronide:cation symporter